MEEAKEEKEKAQKGDSIVNILIETVKKLPALQNTHLVVTNIEKSVRSI